MESRVALVTGGTGGIGTSIVLITVGAILKYAITEGNIFFLDIQAAGTILLVIGILGLVPLAAGDVPLPTLAESGRGRGGGGGAGRPAAGAAVRGAQGPGPVQGLNTRGRYPRYADSGRADHHQARVLLAAGTTALGTPLLSAA